MHIKVAKCVLLIAGLLADRRLSAQDSPPAANRPWHFRSELGISKELAGEPQPLWGIDPKKFYTLPELIDLAELHNPETRASWNRAKIRAAERLMWQRLPTLRTVYILELALLQVSLNGAPGLIPTPTKLQAVDIRFYEAIAASLNQIADCWSQLDGAQYKRSHQEKVRESRAQRELRCTCFPERQYQ
jgi:hypothetical protein